MTEPGSNTPYTDTCGDGYGDPLRPILACEAPDYNMMKSYDKNDVNNQINL